MERHSRVSEERLELLRKMLLSQGSSLEQKYPYFEQQRIYMGLREAMERGPSLEERATLYSGSMNIILALGCISALVIAAALPFKSISFAAFVIILLVSRAADILSTVFGLQMPGMIESNPHSDMHRLSPEFIFKYASGLLFYTGFAYLLSYWCPLAAKVMLLAQAMVGFVVTASNLYQTLFQSRSGMAFFVISSSIMGTGVYFLLKFLSQAC